MKKILLSVLLAVGCGQAPAGLNSATEHWCSAKGSPLEHDTFVFKDGSVITTCQTIWPSGDSAYAVRMYRSDQFGAHQAGCSLTNPAGGWILFSLDGEVSTVMDYSTNTTTTLSCNTYTP